MLRRVPVWHCILRLNGSRFYDLAWSEPSKDHTRGVLAVALENGSLDLFDAEKLIIGEGYDSASPTANVTEG